MSADRPIAIVTGASTGIGCELARRCANEGYDLLIAADKPAIEQAAASLRSAGQSGTLQADLATIDGVDELYSAAKGPTGGCAAGQRRPWSAAIYLNGPICGVRSEQ